MINIVIKKIKQIFIAIFILFSVSFANELSNQGDSQHIWLFIREKEKIDLQKVGANNIGISERALKRRAKALPAENLIDELDIPVSQNIINSIKSTGAKIRTISRWFNAVSVEATSKQIQRLQSIPEVVSLKPVVKICYPRIPKQAEESIKPLFKSTGLSYGNSFTQLNNMKVIDLHNLGVTGYNVLIGVLDDGFNNFRVHPALKNMEVVADSDFIHNISDVNRQPWEDPVQGNHGAGVLSAIGGFDDGKMIGAAYGASFMLAKTEMDSSGSKDFHSEEDTYVAALEWMEREGADITSSSLGYKEFWGTSYTTSDMNGRTTLVAQGAVIAARKGVLVVTAMGNDGKLVGGLHKDSTLVSPADADSIIAVGASYSSKNLVYFSGCGPTADGRIKPEVVAQGVNVYWSDGNMGYEYANGTSCSTPLVAGAAALVLSAHPYLNNMQVREALLNTAIQVKDGTTQTQTYPNNYYGYGFVNALEAALYHGPVFSNRVFVNVQDTVYRVYVFIRQKSSNPLDSVYLYYKRSSEALYTKIELQHTGDYEYYTLLDLTELDSTSIGFVSARADDGLTYCLPYDTTQPQLLLQWIKNETNIIPLTYRLYQNYPNPFNGFTNIMIDVPRPSKVELTVFNILGQKIRTIFSGIVSHTSTYQWDGSNSKGQRVSSGIYFIVFKTPTGVISKKMLYLK